MVLPPVKVGGEELIEEIAMGGMVLDAIGPRLPGTARGLAEGSDGLFDLLFPHGRGTNQLARVSTRAGP